MPDTDQRSDRRPAAHGIEEGDHPLPGWWSVAALVSAVLAFGSLFLSVIRPDLTDPTASYDRAVTAELQAQFAEIGNLSPTAGAMGAFMTDPEKARWLRVGEAIFTANCVSCHGSDGGGVSGPNLTDDHYIRVRELTDVAETVIGGSIAAGMPAWKDQLSMNEIVLVSAYAASLRGGFVDGKAPDGEPIAPWFPGGTD